MTPTDSWFDGCPHLSLVIVAVLVDLGDAIADEMALPFDRISLEMVYRCLYHFTVAYDKGKAINPVKYFAEHENQDLGVVKALRSAQQKIDLSPFPESKLPPEKFYHPTLLTKCTSP